MGGPSTGVLKSEALLKRFHVHEVAPRGGQVTDTGTNTGTNTGTSTGTSTIRPDHFQRLLCLTRSTRPSQWVRAASRLTDSAPRCPPAQTMRVISESGALAAETKEDWK